MDARTTTRDAIRIRTGAVRIAALPTDCSWWLQRTGSVSPDFPTHQAETTRGGFRLLTSHTRRRSSTAACRARWRGQLGGAAKKMMHDMRSHSSEASVFPIHRGFKISGHVDDAIQSRPHSASVCRASSTPIPPHLGSACRRVRAEGNLSRTFSGNLHFMSSGDSQTSGSESYTPPSSLAGEPHDASDTQRRARRFTSVEDTTTETAIGVSSAIEIPNVRRKRQTD